MVLEESYNLKDYYPLRDVKRPSIEDFEDVLRMATLNAKSNVLKTAHCFFYYRKVIEMLESTLVI